MAYNDDVGGALLARASALGSRVPQDLAVIGVDNEPLGQFTSRLSPRTIRITNGWRPNWPGG